MSKGKGRGRGQGLSFNIEAIGFGRGDALPTSLLQPPPDYPPLKKRPVPLIAGEDQKYLLALQKEFEKTLKNSPYYIKEEEKKHFVDRYSDKYRTSNYSDNTLGWEPDWTRFPAELRIDVRKKRKPVKPMMPRLKERRSGRRGGEDVVKKLEELEKKDATGEEATAVKKPDEEEKESGNESVVEDADDMEDEEENDYLTSYFDNGESYLDEEEDNLDEKEGGIY